jgi:DNA-binding beta-propeller fold protein YncE
MTMKKLACFFRALLVVGAGIMASRCFAASTPDAAPYRILGTNQVAGLGPINYVTADNDGRRLYVPRGPLILVFDLDTLQSVGQIPNTEGRGVAVDPRTHHGFSSSSPISMFDTTTFALIQKIPVQGNPSRIFFEPASERVYVFSHSEPHATVIDPADGSIVGSFDLGGAPEQAASDGQGSLYVDIASGDNVAVVDVKTLRVKARYSLGGKARAPTALALDAKNRVLFVFCRDPARAVMLNADDGTVLGSLPIGNATDGGSFNPRTMEAFSSQRDGTLTVIKENSPTNFVVEQTVKTMSGAKTSALDTKNNRLILITLEDAPIHRNVVGSNALLTPPSSAPAAAMGSTAVGGRSSLLDILVVGRPGTD